MERYNLSDADPFITLSLKNDPDTYIIDSNIPSNASVVTNFDYE